MGTSLLQTDDCPNTTRSCAASNCYNKCNPIMYLSMTHGEGLTERKQKFSYYRPFALCNAVIVQLYRFSQEQIQDIQRGRLVHIFLMVPKLHCSNSHPLLSSCVIV